MKIIVCAKIVLDPEAPASLFKVDSEARKVIPPKGTPPVINPFDENAIEAALKLKERGPSTITILSLGTNLPKPVVRKSLATGADNLILLEDELFNDLDSYATAVVLGRAIEKIGSYDLILCGREAADSDAGQVGLGLAELLGIPSTSLASKIEAGAGKLKVERIAAEGYETIELPLPALVTVSSEIGTLRTANMPGIIASQKKPVTIWKAGDLGISQPLAKRTVLHNLLQPLRETKCEIISGDSPEGAAANLVLRLKEVKAI
jgi:electron transfer flavoprotein beta subunit